MNKHQVITWAVVLGFSVLLIVFDVVVVNIWSDSTISQVMLTVAHNYPIIPFSIGVLMGHLFASQKAEAQWKAKLNLPVYPSHPMKRKEP